MTKNNYRRRLGAFFALSIFCGMGISSVASADGLMCTQVMRICKNGKTAKRMPDSCAQICPEDQHPDKKPKCPEPAAPLCKDGEVATIEKGKRGCPVAVCKPIVACKLPACPAPRDGCSYNLSAAPKDANGCATSCGPMVCNGHGPALCKKIACAAPRVGCNYNLSAAPKDANGCATSCGPLVCNSKPIAKPGTPATVSGSAQ